MPPGTGPHGRGHFCTAGCVSFRTGTLDAVGDRIPGPARVTWPHPEEKVPDRAEWPRQGSGLDGLQVHLGAAQNGGRVASGQPGQLVVEGGDDVGHPGR